MKTVRLADCPALPWRNGGGHTHELLAWPSAADWQLRVSVAEIAADGPFSPYPGIDRWFAVLGGAGVVLALPQGEITLRPGSAAVAFAGETAPACRLIDGPTHDLNLMRRRGARPSWHGVFADDTLHWSDDLDEALPALRGWRLGADSMERIA
jgi:uncharacterized protein